MAMTAWAAKFCDQRDLLLGEGTNLLAVDNDRADQFVLLEHRHDQHGRARTGEIERTCGSSVDVGLVRLRSAMWMTCLVLETRSSGIRRIGLNGSTPPLLSTISRRMPCWHATR